MYDLFRRILKKGVLPAIDRLIGVLPRSLRVFLMVGVADSLGLRNVRFDAPMRYPEAGGGKTPYLNLGLYAGDRSVIPSVILSGQWELAEPRFVADHLRAGTSYTLVDVGANFGLFTLQVMDLARLKLGESPIRRIHLFEPDPSIVPILTANVASLATGDVSVNVIDRALGTEAGRATFYLDNSNKANNSLAPRAMDRAVSGVTKVEVDVMAAAEILTLDTGAANDRIVYKSDLQGIDPTIASAIPMEFWQRVDVFIVELWPQVLKDYEFFTDVFQRVVGQFDVITLEDNGKTRRIVADDLPAIIADARDYQYFNLLCHRL